MQVSVLASGSKGNATLVAMNGAKILVDAGISATRIKKALAAENVDAADLDAVLLTHEHRDHVAGLATLAKWYHLPIYSRRRTLASLPLAIQQAIADAGNVSLTDLLGSMNQEDERVAEPRARYDAIAPSSQLDTTFEPSLFDTLPSTSLFDATPKRTSCKASTRASEHLLHAVDDSFRLFGLRITPFSVPHDAADPVGWRIEGDETVTVCTDLGFVTQSVAASIDATDVLVLEANHDPETLKNGSYAWPLKRRILGSRGHLANADAAWAIAHMQQKPKDVFLAHLSQENNRPELAKATVQNILAGQGIEIPIHVTSQTEAVRLM
jgi:phosphoribosyl 1,2-cyclic phosphodiesterase